MVIILSYPSFFQSQRDIISFVEQFIINGPCKLSGNISISGAKNAALPIIASSVLFSEPVILRNVPMIKDISAMILLLKSLGAKCDFRKNALKINCKDLKNINPNPDLVRNLRASILLLAPLLSRNKKVVIPHPGGCLIGARPIDIHLEALKNMGADVREGENEYNISAESLKPTSLFADFSVTGTENLIMAAVLTKGKTEIKLAASEPHVQDFCNFLVKAGANIRGVGTPTLIIDGVEKLNEIEYKIMPDQIEAGTYAIAVAASKGDLTIHGFMARYQDALLSKFKRANVNYEILDGETFRILPSNKIKAFNLRTEVYPGFPTDLQAPMAVLAAQAEGTSNFHETIFEGRLGYINELSKMGANCKVLDTHQAVITGPTPLTGTRITSFDLRAGATLIIAALIAKGESRLDQIEIIDRGYEEIEKKLNSIGAKIKRIRLKEIE